MTCIIPLINKGDTRELRYALRSLYHNGGITRCILVGGKPDWYIGDHIPHGDYRPEYKEQNIRDKVILGSNYVEGPFLMANDDHFVFKPITKVFNKGLLSDTLKTRSTHSSYAITIKNTINRFGDVPDVDLHCPMWMDRSGLRAMTMEFADHGEVWPRFGLLFKTAYCQVNGIESEYMADYKTNRVENMENREWFSTMNYFNGLENIFPVPSCFEK